MKNFFLTLTTIGMMSVSAFADVSYTCSQSASPDEVWVYTLSCNSANEGRITIDGYQTSEVYVGSCEVNKDGSLQFTAKFANPNATDLSSKDAFMNLGKLVKQNKKYTFVLQGLQPMLIKINSINCQ